jgi:hypothetical protein
MAEPGSAAPGQSAARSPSCEGATWTARAVPRVNGGENMNIIACLFPYKNGYHLDMYAVFTKREGGLLEWPRRMTGRIMGTPETWTENAMIEVIRTIRQSTGAEVALVEAKPELNGQPWMQATGGAAGMLAPVSTSAPAPATAPESTSATPAPATTAPVPPAAPAAPAAPTAAGSAGAPGVK